MTAADKLPKSPLLSQPELGEEAAALPLIIFCFSIWKQNMLHLVYTYLHFIAFVSTTQLSHHSVSMINSEKILSLQNTHLPGKSTQWCQVVRRMLLPADTEKTKWYKLATAGL